jgi:hypothetical protein
MKFYEGFHYFQLEAFNVVMYMTWVLYAAIALGLSVNAPQYLTQLHSFVKIYVSLFLIFRFNPFRQVKFTELDAKIAFSAGTFLLTTSAIDETLRIYLLNDIERYIMPQEPTGMYS